MHCVIEGYGAKLYGPFSIDFLKSVITKLAGKKSWTGSSCIQIVMNDYNKQLLTDNGVEIQSLADCPTDDEIGHQQWKYEPRVTLRRFQTECLAKSWSRKAYAVFAEMGLGKTAIQIANIGRLVAAGKVTGVLIIAPNGVHNQWIEEEFPKHVDPNMKWSAVTWEGSHTRITNKLDPKAQVEILAMNVDAIRLKRERKDGTWRITHFSHGIEAAEEFLRRHNGRSMMIVDESHNIKNAKSQRTKAAMYLGNLATYRRILTGTPISRNLMDAWSQFQFLDPNILGYRNPTAFRSHFCQMGGYGGKEIIGHQNLEEFYAIIAPYTYRKTKKEVTDLPDKIYSRRQYEMSDETKRHYKSMKKQWLTRFDNGEIKDAKNAIVAMLRLQQIICGYLEREDGTMENIGSEERLDAMMEIIDQTEGQTIIWARFTHDVETIYRCLLQRFDGSSAVAYYGQMTMEERKESKKRFASGEARFFVGNIGISAGLDGLQCASNMIFYSNDFDALHRWQAEDRAHRFGMVGLTIFDLIARNSIDYAILRNLSDKKSLSDLTLDQIRNAIAEF